MLQKLTLIILLFILVACANEVEPTPTPIVLVETETIPSTSVPTPTDTIAPTEPPAIEAPTATPTNTPLPPTPTPVVNDEELAAQLAVFDDLWQTVNDFYVDPAFNGVDWDAVRDDYLAQIEVRIKPEEFWHLMAEMINLLGDDHSYYLDPVEAEGEDALNRGEEAYVGVGIIVFPRPELGDALVGWAIAGNGAYDAGIRTRDRLLAVDGEPLCCDERGELFDLIPGPDGTTLIITVQSPGEQPRDVEVTRRPIQINDILRAKRLNGNIGYIELYTFLVEGTGEQFEEAWRALNEPEPVVGLILDFRPNSGGFHSERDKVLELFTFGELGAYISRTDAFPLNLAGRDVLGSQSIPLVVLIGAGTNSNGEVFAGTLQEAGRAILVGNATRANVESLYPYNFADGSRLWLAEEAFVPPSGADWESEGLTPDIVIEQTWDNFTSEADDEALQAALDYLTELLDE